MAILARFKIDLIQSNHVWIVANDDNKCRLFWNSMDNKTAQIQQNSFSTTTFYKSVDLRHHCSNCSIFSGSSLNKSASDVPSCPHVSFAEEVLQAVDLHSESGNDCAFVRFLRQRLSDSKEINVVRSAMHRLTLLVIADSDRCLKASVRKQESIVSIQKAGSNFDAIIFCSNVECKRKKLVAYLKNPSDFCPHFAKVWSTPSIVSMVHSVIGVPSESISWGLSKGLNDDISEGLLPIGEARDESENFDNVVNNATVSSPVRYEVSRQRYVPSDGIISPIPIVKCPESDRWAEKRKCGFGVERDGDGCLLWNSSGYLTGSVACDVKCQQTCCPVCGVGSLQNHRIGDFKLYTYIGCVLRKRYAVTCDNEGQKLSKHFTFVTYLFMQNVNIEMTGILQLSSSILYHRATKEVRIEESSF